MASSALRDRRILVVEDEYLIAMNLQDGLENAGSVVLGPVPSVEKALKKIESEPHIDAAVLDVNLGGALAYPVADLLAARKIPFVFTSGYARNAIVHHGRLDQGVQLITKPFSMADLATRIRDVLDGLAGEPSSGRPDPPEIVP